MTTENEQLKPCPFCGSEAESSLGRNGDGSDWRYIECTDCRALANPDVWNTRHPAPLRALTYEAVYDFMTECDYTTMGSAEARHGFAKEICAKFAAPSIDETKLREAILNNITVTPDYKFDGVNIKGILKELQ